MATEEEVKTARRVLNNPAKYQEYTGLVAWAEKVIDEQVNAGPQRGLFDDAEVREV